MNVVGPAFIEFVTAVFASFGVMMIDALQWR